jgi:hypothetical protein
MLAGMSSRTLSEWMAYYGLEPFGEGRADLRMGILAATVANSQRGKDQQPFKPEQFMPQFEEQERDGSSWEQMLERVRMINAALGGTEG